MKEKSAANLERHWRIYKSTHTHFGYVQPMLDAEAGPLFVCFPVIKITLPFGYFLILKNTEKKP